MRLALLIGRFPPGHVGGAELQAEQWATRLARRHDVTVITRRHRADEPAQERRAGPDTSYDIVRTALPHVPVVRTLADVLAIGSAVRGLPQRPDLLLCFQTFVSGAAGVWLQSRLGVPAVVWVRGEGEYRFAGSRRARLVGPRVWDRARGVLVQSAACGSALVDELRPLGAERARRVESKLAVVPNGIALPAERAPGGDAVLVLGRLIRDKGVDTVIDAMAALPGVELLVAGDGPERAALEARAADRGVRATFLGVVGRDQLGSVFARARCLVMASRFGEGFPNVLLEALAWGVPVVATPVGGITDLVTDGHNGLLMPVDDPTAVTAAVTRLRRDDDLVAQLVSAGREIAESYAWDAVEQRLEPLLDTWSNAPGVQHRVHRNEIGS